MMNRTKEQLAKLIGGKISYYRKKRKYSQQTLADLIGISRTSIVNIEKSRHTPSLFLTYKLAHVLNIEIALLLPTLAEVVNYSPTEELSLEGLNNEQRTQVLKLYNDFNLDSNEKKTG